MKAKHSTSVKLNGVGIAYLAVLALSMVAGVNETNSLALLLASLLLGLFLVVLIKGALNIPLLRLDHLEFDNTFAGDPVALRGRLASRFPVPDAPLKIVVESTTDQGECSPTGLEATSGFSLSLPPQRRGRLQLESVKVSSSYPLGLLKWSIRFDDLAVTGLIYPAPIDYLITPEQALGQTESAGIGDFDELQTWQRGDSLSGVCWKTFAKTGKRMQKRFLEADEESSSVSILVADDNACLDGDSLTALSDEEQRSQLCYWVVEKQRRQEPYGLRFRGRVIATGSDSRHFDRCLETLTEG